MVEVDSTPEETGQDTMLQEAISALHKGDRVRARDILTRLLKVEQKNAAYWIWLSAAVDTQKERLYCLQSALQIDPENASAKRGLVLLGGLAADDSVPPFPLNHPRQWEEKLTIPQELKNKPRSSSSLILRLFITLASVAVVLAFTYFGFLAPKALLLPYFRSGPHYVTPKPTTTGHPSATPLATLSTPTPIELQLDTTYTPTPLYVMTPHPEKSKGDFDAGVRFFKARDYKNAVIMFNQVLTPEPQAADVYYYIAESYWMTQDYQRARDYYQFAINIDPNFAPGYLGRALVNRVLNPDTDISLDLTSAINLDPHFIAAYIERGAYRRTHNDPTGAIKDLQSALELNPDSALAYLYLAQVQLDLGQNEIALESAQKANQIDLTLIPTYLVLAQAYIANDQVDKATDALRTYTQFVPDDINAYLTLGSVYNAIGQYQAAMDILNRYINDKPRDVEGYYQRGITYLHLGNAALARIDFTTAVDSDPAYFDGYIGLGQALDALGQANNAYITVDKNCTPLIKTDKQKAQVYYWEAIFLEEMKNTAAAQGSWRRLLELPAEAMPEDWRNQAYVHLGITPSETPTSRYTQTLTLTPTLTPTLSPTP